MPDRPCPFCSPAHERIVRAFDAALVLRDGYPISPGHTLIVPRRHVGSFFALEAGEQAAMLEALNWARAELERLHHPAAFNIGMNDGPAAGARRCRTATCTSSRATRATCPTRAAGCGGSSPPRRSTGPTPDGVSP